MEYVWRSSSGLERRGRAANVVKLRVIFLLLVPIGTYVFYSSWLLISNSKCDLNERILKPTFRMAPRTHTFRITPEL